MVRGFDNIGLTAYAETKMDSVKALLIQYQYLQPLGSKFIESRFKLTGPEVRAIISELTCRGNPICSGKQGYWWATTVRDIDKTTNHLEDRCRRMQRRVAALKKARQAMIFHRPAPVEQMRLM